MGAVKKKEATEMVEFDQSMFEADAGVGVSDMGQDDLALPFLKLISGLDSLLDDPDFDGGRRSWRIGYGPRRSGAAVPQAD